MEYRCLGRDVGVSGMVAFARITSQHESTNREKYDVILTADEAKKVVADEYGEYPQTLMDPNKCKELERAFAKRKSANPEMRETGKDYWVMFPKTEMKVYTEYAYKGHRYVRVTPLVDMNVQSYGLEANKPVWCEVEPIKWVKDKDGNYKADKMLFAGRMVDSDHPNYMSETDFSAPFDTWFKENFSHDILSKKEIDVQIEENEQAKPQGGQGRRRGYGVTIEEKPMSVKEQIDFYIKTGKSFMLHGPSGCGKTRRIRDIDPDFTAVPFVKGCMPEQIVGKVCYPGGASLSPVDKDGKGVDLPDGGVWMPPEWYVDICKKCAKEPDKMHVVFIDEVTNGSESSQSLLFQIVERKSVTGSHGKLPKNSVVVLAGNSKEESGAAYNMPEPLYRRAHGHIYLTPNVADWLEWGSQKSTSHPDEEGRLNVHPLIAAFVAAYGKDCFYTKFDEEEPDFTMDPRGWEQVSDIIYDNNGVIRRELLESKMGKEFAATFFEFAKNPPITVEEILSGEIENLPIPQRPDEKLALVYGLRHVSEREVGKVRGFVKRYLGKEMKSTFDEVWCKDKPERALYLKRLDDKTADSKGR